MSDPNDSDENSPNKDNPTEPASNNTSIQNNSDPQPPSSPSTGSLLLTLQSAFIYVFAAAVSLGLILNLFGYGYMVTPSEGLRIDTLSELRMEQQLQPPPSDGSTSRQPGGLSEFFLKNPFTTSLIVTGLVLAYESLFLDKKNKKGDDK